MGPSFSPSLTQYPIMTALHSAPYWACTFDHPVLLWQFYTDFVKIITVNGRQWGKRQPVVTRRDVHAGLMPLMLQRFQLLLHRALPAETPLPKRVQCLFRITHSWLRVGQHFLAPVPFVGLWLTNETLNRAKQKLDRNWKASNAIMIWIRSLIHVITEGTKR